MFKRIILSISAMLILASCSDKFGIMKRRYNKGYFIASSHSLQSKSHAQDKVAQLKKSDEQKELAVITPLEKNNLNVSEEKEMKAQKDLFVLPKVASKAGVHAVPATKAIASSDKKLYVATPLLKKNATEIAVKKGDKSDTDLIIQVILALFPILCLIAVFLSDGKDITINFWIDLLLHLTFIGEIIFALLVVLDVVDLR